eukprot:CAMPEP_0202856998 /NCGR_PEP_ID=MMETSP1391-20130828/98_1 /ASSEMBLY_ACC=CAM_ASM_000867 /TAXON_ID=1034604 /ORGANISM="Chlamydomonas leiostraca, Strain SAG 11-49" /LENGTH=69 /DNA_ID=CAMNT_0049535737 /DNA_START=77 /DNA_END=284 /DNA_ORIENTATION=-
MVPALDQLHPCTSCAGQQSAANETSSGAEARLAGSLASAELAKPLCSAGDQRIIKRAASSHGVCMDLGV